PEQDGGTTEPLTERPADEPHAKGDQDRDRDDQRSVLRPVAAGMHYVHVRRSAHHANARQATENTPRSTERCRRLVVVRSWLDRPTVKLPATFVLHCFGGTHGSCFSGGDELGS